MRQDRDYYLSRSWFNFALLVFLACSAAPGIAQKTVVQDAGGGKKVELEYNAAGKVTEQRTIGADGKVEEKVEYQQQPGYYAADKATTTFWPDGKVRKIAKSTYDANGNFLGESIQVFDQSGKQTSGSRLTHDPMTNVYVCREWNAAAQAYKVAECPAGEESGGSEEVKKFTYEEVLQHLNAARKVVGEKEGAKGRDQLKPAAAAAKWQVGLVVPAQVQAGERVSGSLVADSAAYEGVAGVQVTPIDVPQDSTGEGSSLAGWTVEVPGENPQRADGPIVFTVPRDGSGLNITFKQTTKSDRAVSKHISFPQDTSKKQKPPTSFEAAALCMKGQLCPVRGPFSGDSSKTFAAFEDRPAMIVIETPDSAYVRIPDQTEAGARPLYIAEGSKVVALPVAVGDFYVKNLGRELQQGQVIETYPTLEGPGDIPDALWLPGNFPSTNLEQARKLVPGFQLPKQSREAREKREAKGNGESKEKREADEKKGGTILVVVKNLTPDQVSMRGGKDQMIVFHLNDESFTRGEFKYDLVVEALKSGHFDVRGYIIPFLAPVHGQEFSGNSNATAK